jgi:hypothetical protein
MYKKGTFVWLHDAEPVPHGAPLASLVAWTGTRGRLAPCKKHLAARLDAVRLAGWLVVGG